MALFRYIALSPMGKKQKGFLEAAHLQEAKDKLRYQGGVILKLVPWQKPFFSSPKKKLKGDLLVAFTTQLGELLIAKVPLYESLVSLEEMYRGESYHYVLQTLVEDIKRGMSLTQSMMKFSHIFSPLYIAMVRAGEAVGSLDEALKKLGILLKKESQLRKKLITTLIYPAILAAFSLFVITILMVYVIPSLEALFEGRVMNGFTGLVFYCSHMIRTFGFPLLGGILLTVPLGIYFKKRNKKQFKEIFFKIPMIKKLVVEAAMARFCRTLCTLLEGGVSMKEALSMGRGVLGFAELEGMIAQAEQKIVEGSFLSVELKKHLLIPSLVGRMAAIGEEGGNMAEMLGRAADFFEEEVEKKLTRLMALMGPLILLVMGTIVGLIMMALLLPLTDVNMFMR